MPRRRLKVKRHESISKEKIKSLVVQEIDIEEARKDLLEAEFILTEYKPVLQVNLKSSLKDENRSAPWYFTHT